MPNKTVYIRKKDLELWDNLKDKSEAIHNLLTSAATLTPANHNTQPATPITTPQPTQLSDTELDCCKLSTPCKHWTYNDLTATWRNTLSGRTREVV